MKKILMMAACAALAASAADSNPFADYGPATASNAASPMAAEFQNRNDDDLAQATTPEALSVFVKDETAARDLLAKVTSAYASCPKTLTVVAAVSQHVMRKEEGCPFLNALAFWRRSRAAERGVWTRSLLAVAGASNDYYVQMFMLDQLRWCGMPCQAPAIRALGSRSSGGVREFADLVARELEAAGAR
ncbi:MAG: hypothetical protein ACI4Q3_08300 [Kiritimatiellia bacterium]